MKSNLLHSNAFKKAYSSSKNITKTKIKGVTEEADTIYTYLNKRLAEIGVKHVMAIPGDYIAEWVETLDNELINEGLIRVHPNNEMCATYAADGYGRAANGKTIGCVAFTYGVGALNAVQAVAGAHVEYSPLVLVNGSPSPAQFNSQRDQGVLWHHMFDGSKTDLKVLSEVTEMAVRIDNPAYAPDLIDAALTACITHSRPVYIEIANTLGELPCQSASSRPALIPSPLPQDHADLEAAASYIMNVMQKSEKLIVMGGVEIARSNLQGKFKELIQLLKAPYISSLLGKSILSEYDNDIYFSGVYNGRNSQQNVQDLFKSDDGVVPTLLSLGVMETDFNFTGVASVDYDPELDLPLTGQIEARMGAVKINARASKDVDNEVYWGNINLGDLIDILIKKIKNIGNWPPKPFPGLQEGTPWDIPTGYDPTKQITWDSFKSLFYHDYLATFEEADAPVVLADTGLTFYSLNNIKVPQNGYIAQLAWGAIGYSPAASYGVKLALEDIGDNRQVVSISGDGAISESINCLGTIAELGQNNIIFAMANGVFAIEQFLVDVNAFKYEEGAPKFKLLTQVPQTSLWDWKKLAEGFGGVGYEVTTNQELSDVLAQIKTPPAPATPSGPCSNSTHEAGCCEFDANWNDPVRKSTFTLIAVRNVCKDLPSNTKWKFST
ncbi:thiamine pyrophosphate-dependent enzyme [Ancylomarina sp. DW003]|nr:thiamine pyrophosphate-binding protein [Ancylomarina sp. DW003]MDE5422677.1 thiamine pyrophosphate-dependent enzyme [Ancylomarina sp. DW003]